MRIDNHPNFGIRGHNVNNITLQDVVIDGTTGTSSTADVDIVNGEDQVRIINLTGSALIDNCFIGGGYEKNLRIVNDSGSLNRLTVSDSTIGDLDGAGALRGVDSADGDDNVVFSAADGALTQMNGTFTNNILNNARGDVFQAANSDVSAPAATMDIVFRGNSVSNNHPVIVIAGGGVTFNGTGAMTYDISCNKFRDSKGHGLNVFKQRPASGQTGGTWSGTIFNNRVGVSGVGDSGGLGNGIQVEAQGNGTHTTLIKNNQVFNYNSAGIRLGVVDANTSGPTALTMNATVIGNLSTQPDPVNAFASFHAVQGAVQAADHTTTLNLKLGGAGAEQNDFADGDPITVDVAFQRATSPIVGTFTLSQGASGVSTPIETVVANNNDNSPALTFSIDPGISVVGSVPALPAATDQTCSPPPLLFAEGGVESVLDDSSLLVRFMFGSIAAPNCGPAKTVVSSIEQHQLDAIAAAAIDRWTATGLTVQQLASMQALKFEIADLGGSYLGQADGNRIMVDRDAGGKGWFVDGTPAEDIEYGERISATRRYTNPSTSAAGRLDLLTAIEHEIGHRLGLDDSYAEKDRDSVMYGYLTVGERRVPKANQAANAHPGSLMGSHYLKLGKAEVRGREIRGQKSSCREPRERLRRQFLVKL